MIKGLLQARVGRCTVSERLQPNRYLEMHAFTLPFGGLVRFKRKIDRTLCPMDSEKATPFRSVN
jgi:hypothetical protein